MAAVDIRAENLHVGEIVTVTGAGSGLNGIRPICRTCGWRGPAYGNGDAGVAQVGLDAHIATAVAVGDDCRYTITFSNWTVYWNWDTLEWR